MKLEFSWQIFEESPNIKFYQNPSSGSRFVPCGQTDLTKLILAFRNFSNAPKNLSKCQRVHHKSHMDSSLCDKGIIHDVEKWLPKDLLIFCLFISSCLPSCINLLTHRHKRKHIHTRISIDFEELLHTQIQNCRNLWTVAKCKLKTWAHTKSAVIFYIYKNAPQGNWYGLTMVNRLLQRER
jgi:hypothetical protein